MKVKILLTLMLTLILLFAARFQPLYAYASTAEEHPVAQMGNQGTETWTSAGSSVCAWFNEEEPKDSMGVNTNPTVIRVGKTDVGKDIFSFLRLPMRGTWFGNEMNSARLYLKIADGEAPVSLRIELIKGLWSNSFTTLADAQKMLTCAGGKSVAVRHERDGWVSMDITHYVAAWLNGDTPNYGIVILGETIGKQTAFFSDWDEKSRNPPNLEVTGVIGSRDLCYGKFEYIRHPANKTDDSRLTDNETANCLSYALRDVNMIDAADLGLDYDEMTRICRESGEDAVADYCAGRVEDYVERQKSALKITGFRRIDNFDSEIDPVNEYRIALRVGCDLYGEEDVLDEVAGNFDFHLWAQINTGQWAQKFIFDPSEIVPCTPPGVSPARYSWDASLLWGNDKFSAFYTSKAVYFAVTKDADGFTEHKAE